MNNEVVQKLKFRAKGLRRLFGSFQKKTLGFTFTQYAWFIAFDLMGVDPSKFDELSEYDKHIALCYGAAKYWCWKNSVKPFFTKDELEAALKRNSLEDNEKIVEAQRNAVFAEWMKAFMEEEEQSPEAAKKK